VDRKLLAWGLRTKPGQMPRLWLFTDDERLPEPREAVAGLPRGRAGVVLRHDTDPDRWALGHDLARICRLRRLLLVVAGDVRLACALRVGVHLRGGRWPGPVRPPGLRSPSLWTPSVWMPSTRPPRIITSSGHSLVELRLAARAGANLVFLSPAFPTASHVGAPGLGPSRWGAIVRRFDTARTPMQFGALGGVDGRNVLRLPAGGRRSVGAITALSP
jgi:thiamine-phosphate pyrophosphorylase